ncbi:MAG: hypothetical protein Q9166_007177 [cf. Caloplaca sp. 2 TL-2023]
MGDLLENVNPFVTPDLWQESSFGRIEIRGYPLGIDELLSFEFFADSDSNAAVRFLQQTPVALPTLDISINDPLQTSKCLGVEQDGAAPFSCGPLEGFEAVEESSASSDQGDNGGYDDVLEDLWSSKEIIKSIVGPNETRTWENFHGKTFREPRSAYISEAGPRIFDAAISVHQPAPALQSDAVLSSLVQLSLGRDSVLYLHDTKELTLQSIVEGNRMSGYTSESFNSLVQGFSTYGSQIRRLQDFVDTIENSRKATSSFITLASGVRIVVAALETQLAGSIASIRTVLQLQALVEKPRHLLEHLIGLVDKANDLRDDTEILSMTFGLMRDTECSSPWLPPITSQLLAHISRPWLESVEASIGLRQESLLGTASATTDAEMLAEHCLLESGGGVQGNRNWRMPDFISSDMAETIVETRYSLHLLRTHEPEHPLARSSLPEPPSLQWQLSWEDVERIEAQAQTYESNVLHALNEYNTSGTHGGQQGSAVTEQLESPNGNLDFTDLLSQMEQPLPDLFNPTTSSLLLTVIQILSDVHSSSRTLTVPAASLLPTLSFAPCLTTQSRLLSHSILHLLFRIHSLRSHLRLLHSYPLFANGPFLVHLSHALFDPSLPSAAYQKGRIRSGSAGLQLGIRETWPPASSELRIALMGILTENYAFSEVTLAGSAGLETVKGKLRGGLSFAICNDMSDAKVEKCMNPDGLEALDFLKIQYRPPKPLNVVITESVLEKYEKVSRLLLKGARVGWVVKEMLRHQRGRNSTSSTQKCGLMQRFKIEAHHFVTTVFGYFGDCIQELWSAFETRLDGIEAAIDCYEVGMKVEGVYRLRDLHEEVLDRILAECLLRKRQELVMGLLEEILRLILQFAKIAREGGKGDHEEAITELYETFRKNVRGFITVCRGLRDQKSVMGSKGVFDGGKGGEEKGNGIGKLVLGLEMNGWYMR